MNQNEFIQYVSNCTEVFYDEPEPEAALIFARALLARAEAAERERNDANIEVALEQAHAHEAWQRVAELEAALTGDIQAVTADGRQHRIITQFLGARPDLKITMTAIPWGENGLLEAPVILATIGDYLGHIFYTERSTTVEVALRGVEQRLVAAEGRVAELEAAQLAAQGWRPVTEDWPPYAKSVPVRMLSGAIRWGYRHGDRWHLTGGQYSRESVTHAYALPPAPDAAGATE